MFLAYLPFLFWLFQLEQQNPLTVPVQTFQREHHTAIHFPASQLEQNIIGLTCTSTRRGLCL